MQVMTSVTQKGQITLPKSLRSLLDINLYDTVTVELGKGHLKVKPVKDILDMVGTVKVKKGQSALKAREMMEKHYKRV